VRIHPGRFLEIQSMTMTRSDRLVRLICLIVTALSVGGARRPAKGADVPRQSIGPNYSADCEEHLAACERLHGPNSPETADAMVSLACFWFEEGASAKAEAVFKRALDAHEAAYGSNSEKTALCLLCYADFLSQEGRSREAVPLLERAVSIHEVVSGPDHPETVLAVRSLAEALLLWEADSRDQASPAVAATAKDNADYFRAHEHAGSRLFQAGEITAASYHFRRAVKLRPDLGENHNNMGTVLSAQDRIDESIAEFAEAAKLAPDVPAIHVNLANALAAGGRFAEAEAKYLELIQGIEKAHADAIKSSGNSAVPIDPAIAALINNYGVALFKQGKKETAIAAFRRALTINPDLEDARESLAVATGENPPLAESAAPTP
jgi:tetratricopeptide (TPR) repeat protein